MKRVFGAAEAAFDMGYLFSAFVLAAVLLFSSSPGAARFLAGLMALNLAVGDAFHLLPRVAIIRTGKEIRFRKALGTGKLVTSVTMTVFYLFLWQIGVIVFSPKDIGVFTYTVYALAALRVFLCLLPQNKWRERRPPTIWGVARNIPFFLQGAAVAALFLIHRNTHPGIAPMWIAVALSFAFYMPVVFWSNKHPKIGMLMLPKTCAYLWMLTMCLSL